MLFYSLSLGQMGLVREQLFYVTMVLPVTIGSASQCFFRNGFSEQWLVRVTEFAWATSPVCLDNSTSGNPLDNSTRYG